MKKLSLRKDIEIDLLVMCTKIGIDIPSNLDDIVEFILQDVLDSTDVNNYTSEDIMIGFRRFIESKNYCNSLEEDLD